jgi:HAD superfamily hydrolase (TIGR01509 family)
MPAPPRNIVFDVGNVLIEWDPRHLFRKLFDDAARMEWFLANVFTSAVNVECDRGLAFADAVAMLTARHPEHAEAIRAFDARWPEMVPGAIAGSVALLDEVRRKGIPDYAITNFSREKFPLAAERFAFLRGFRMVVVSGEEGLVKPDRAIFELFLSRARLDAADCVFIDDSAANVAGARDAGMHALHFRDPSALRGDLRALGFDLE